MLGQKPMRIGTESPTGRRATRINYYTVGGKLPKGLGEQRDPSRRHQEANPLQSTLEHFRSYQR
jgi:hypothetical protein